MGVEDRHRYDYGQPATAFTPAFAVVMGAVQVLLRLPSCV